MTLAQKPVKNVAEKRAKTVHAKSSTVRYLVTIIACAKVSGATIELNLNIPGKSKRILNSYDSEYLRTWIKDAMFLYPSLAEQNSDSLGKAGSFIRYVAHLSYL